MKFLIVCLRLKFPRWIVSSASDALMEIESVQLFMERATFTAPGFAISSQNALVIAQICQRLEGIPLAIELAAARVTC